jgi:uncharacterized RDD family membrane protein YckC
VPNREPAGIVSRSLAGAVDAAVLLAIAGTAYLALTAFVFLLDPLRFRFPAPPRLVCATTVMVLSVCYLTGGWATAGRTYGAQVMGLRVVDGAGAVPHVGRALARAVLCVVFPLGLLWAAVSRRRLSVPDLLLRTSVVYDWAPPRVTASPPAGEPGTGSPPGRP